MTEATLRAVDRLLAEFRRTILAAPPSSEMSCTVILDRGGHLVRSSGITPPRITVDALDGQE